MRGRRVLALVALSLLGLVATGVAVVALLDSETDDSTMRPVRARATLSDRIVVFGDTVRARIDLALDLRQVDPGGVKVRTAFAPWRLDANSVPEPSYRSSPGLLLALLVGGCLLLLAAAGALAYLGWPRDHVEPQPEPEPEPELLPTPLEQALELLETAARANGGADQRRSLELVAEVLAERGEEDGLAQAARALAWSPTPPGPDRTKDLAARVRAALEEELRQLEEERLREEAERRRRLEEARARTH